MVLKSRTYVVFFAVAHHHHSSALPLSLEPVQYPFVLIAAVLAPEYQTCFGETLVDFVSDVEEKSSPEQSCLNTSICSERTGDMGMAHACGFHSFLCPQILDRKPSVSGTCQAKEVHLRFAPSDFSDLEAGQMKT